MNEKRAFLALALSLFVLIVWSSIMPKPQPIAKKEVVSQSPPQIISSAPITAAIPSPPLPQQAPEAEELFTFHFAGQELIFEQTNAVLREIIFFREKGHRLILKNGFALNTDAKGKFIMTKATGDTIEYVQSDTTKKIVKRFIFSNTNNNWELQLELANLTNAQLSLDISLILGSLDFATDQANSRYQEISALVGDKLVHPNPRKNAQVGQAKFLAFRDRYSCAIIEPTGSTATALVRTASSAVSEVGLQLNRVVLEPRQVLTQTFRIYLGPQDAKLLHKLNPQWGGIINFGMFDFVGQLLLQLLELLYKLLHNWGLAIICLSLLIYFLLYPLTLKQMRSMKEMQVLQPKVEELRKLYKDNPQKMNKQIMELYRDHKVNPLGGCLPLVLQMPVFIALYQVLMRTAALKGAHFLWIKDLAEPDRLWILPVTLPLLANELNILPIVIAILMFVQQRFSSAAMSGSSAEQQKIMMFMMPIMFGVLFYRMPAGLVLYWLINSSLMLIYQVRISRQK